VFQELELLQSHRHRRPCYTQTREQGQSHGEGEVEPIIDGGASLKAGMVERERETHISLSHKPFSLPHKSLSLPHNQHLT